MNFDEFIGLPVNIVRDTLETAGYSVIILKNSKQKISTDAELVVRVKFISKKQVELIVGEFLINIEEKHGLV